MKTVLTIGLSLLLGSAAFAQTSPAAPAAATWHPRVFSPQELRQDFDSLHAWLQSTHPDLYVAVRRKRAERRWQAARAQLTRPMTRREFLLLTAPLTTQYQDGHTGLYLDAEDEEGRAYDEHGRRFFPLNVRVKDGQLYAANSLNSQLIRPGARITRLNGVPAAQLVAQMKPYWFHDHEANLESTLSRFFNTSLWFVRGWGRQVEVEFVNYGTRQRQRETLAGVPYAQVAPYIYPGRKRQRLTIHEPERLAVLEFTGFADTPATSAFLDSAFTVIRSRHIGHLAVDIRRNGGGNSAVGDNLLRYLTRKPYLQGAAKELKYSTAVPGLARNAWFRRSLVAHAGQFVDNRLRLDFTPTTPAPLVRPELFFTGQVYLLTSPRTFSSGHMLAAAVKTYQLGTVVGEETGNAMNFFGEVLGFQLPHTGLEASCSAAQWWSAGLTDANRRRGVQPDVPVPTTIRDLAEGRDAVLEYLKTTIRAGAGSPTASAARGAR
ncbi:S41 family peptidase [Hymenobacter edaphi]|uniref:Tail specific protease domain-containing protein n=1 Tax=Hymenobacter edaphi TaxID=2211146 RepID=A0A328B719_9BACT|nr:S41 family peptidase [Hymenobacter edaphi]RAK62893.1 hypothetical protein DLM85_22095 [Hymenobacter edaphi]